MRVSAPQVLGLVNPASAVTDCQLLDNGTGDGTLPPPLEGGGHVPPPQMPRLSRLSRQCPARLSRFVAYTYVHFSNLKGRIASHRRVSFAGLSGTSYNRDKRYIVENATLSRLSRPVLLRTRSSPNLGSPDEVISGCNPAFSEQAVSDALERLLFRVLVLSG
jgi:hypothetical protein